MKKYSILESMALSFYAKSLYQDVANAWKGLAVGYLLFVMTICWLPFSYDFHRFLNQFSVEMLPQLIHQVPNITIHQGKLSIDKLSPYAIRQPGDGFTLAMFDTSGRYTSLEKLNTLALVTADQLMIRTGESEKTTVYSLSHVKDVVITKADISALADKVVFWSSVLMYPISVLIAAAYRLLEAFLLGGAALLMAKLMTVEMTYLTAVRLAVVALTPSLLISTLIEYLGNPGTIYRMMSVLLTLGYLSYAVLAQKSAAKKEFPNGRLTG